MEATRHAATPKVCIAELRELRVTADGNTLFPDNRQTPAPGQMAASAVAPKAAPQVVPYTGFQLWMHRLNVLVFVFLCAAMGVLLVIVPWWPQWTDNYYLLGHPTLRAFVSDGFTRGICSGLGILDVWIGFSAAINYREDKPA